MASRKAPVTDELLAEAVEVARESLLDITVADSIGEHQGVTAEEDRLLTHRFSSSVPGYDGWKWFVTVARAPRSKKVTICELGLLPGAGALLAPQWLPWSNRVEQDRAEPAAIADESADFDSTTVE